MKQEKGRKDRRKGGSEGGSGGEGMQGRGREEVKGGWKKVREIKIIKHGPRLYFVVLYFFFQKLLK